MALKLISSESIFGSHFAAERGMDAAFSRKRKGSVERELSMMVLIIALLDDGHAQSWEACMAHKIGIKKITPVTYLSLLLRETAFSLTGKFAFSTFRGTNQTGRTTFLSFWTRLWPLLALCAACLSTPLHAHVLPAAVTCRSCRVGTHLPAGHSQSTWEGKRVVAKFSRLHVQPFCPAPPDMLH